MTNLLITFILLNIANVIIQTAKNLVTVKCGKTIAAIVNAVAFFLYTIVTVYTLCDLPLFLKAGIVGVCNLVGVFAVKWIEEKMRKDKLWKIELTIPTEKLAIVHEAIGAIPHSYIRLSDRYTLFNCYCATQKQSKEVRKVVEAMGAKYFVSESKGVL